MTVKGQPQINEQLREVSKVREREREREREQ